MDKKKDPRLDNARIMIRTAAPVVAALFLFLVSAGYIAYRMISNRNLSYFLSVLFLHLIFLYANNHPGLKMHNTPLFRQTFLSIQKSFL